MDRDTKPIQLKSQTIRPTTVIAPATFKTPKKDIKEETKPTHSNTRTFSRSSTFSDSESEEEIEPQKQPIEFPLKPPANQSTLTSKDKQVTLTGVFEKGDSKGAIAAKIGFNINYDGPVSNGFMNGPGTLKIKLEQYQFVLQGDFNDGILEGSSFVSLESLSYQNGYNDISQENEKIVDRDLIFMVSGVPDFLVTFVKYNCESNDKESPCAIDSSGSSGDDESAKLCSFCEVYQESCRFLGIKQLFYEDEKFYSRLARLVQTINSKLSFNLEVEESGSEEEQWKEFKIPKIMVKNISAMHFEFDVIEWIKWDELKPSETQLSKTTYSVQIRHGLEDYLLPYAVKKNQKFDDEIVRVVSQGTIFKGKKQLGGLIQHLDSSITTFSFKKGKSYGIGERKFKNGDKLISQLHGDKARGFGIFYKKNLTKQYNTKQNNTT